MSGESFLFLISSARRGGNTELLARAAAAHLPQEAVQWWIHHADYPLDDFQDIRHDPGHTYQMPQGAELALYEKTLAADHLIFVAPLYWYCLPTAAKQYLDHWSGWLRLPGENFRERMAGKTLWVVTTLASKDAHYTAPLLDSLQIIAQYMKMRWGGSVTGHGNRPGDVMDDRAALMAADRLFDLT